MTDLVHFLGLGLSVAISPDNLLYCFVGTLLGTLIGVLPGIGPVPAIAMLLPLSFNLEPASALIMLSGIYYGAQYGGSTTAILMNMPGETSSVVTCLDGHAMAKQGRAGPALSIAALGSFFAGTVSTLLIAAFAPLLAKIAFQFGSAEYFALMVMGLVGAIVLASGSLVTAVAMTILGLWLGLVGSDVESGITRFTFDVPQLSDGINFVVVAVGLFGITEVILSAESQLLQRGTAIKVNRLMPSRSDMAQAWRPIFRGSLLGSALGILPGGGALLASFASYSLERRLARDPSRFGQGAIEGIAGPESANNAGAQTSFVPLLTLGLPPNPVMALMLGAIILHGIAPGPRVMIEQPALFWGLIASMWIGNIMLLVLNLPLVGLWVRLLDIPYRWLYPAILAFSCIGVFSIQNSVLDVVLTVGFGLAGYIFSKIGCPPAPLVLGFILGPPMEENLRRTLLLGDGSPKGFVSSPLSIAFLTIALVTLVAVLVPAIRNRRQDVFVE